MKANKYDIYKKLSISADEISLIMDKIHSQPGYDEEKYPYIIDFNAWLKGDVPTDKDGWIDRIKVYLIINGRDPDKAKYLMDGEAGTPLPNWQDIDEEAWHEAKQEQFRGEYSNGKVIGFGNMPNRTIGSAGGFPFDNGDPLY